MVLHGPALGGAERTLHDGVVAHRHVAQCGDLDVVIQLCIGFHEHIGGSGINRFARRATGELGFEASIPGLAPCNHGQVPFPTGNAQAGIINEGLLHDPEFGVNGARGLCTNRVGNHAPGVTV